MKTSHKLLLAAGFLLFLYLVIPFDLFPEIEKEKAQRETAAQTEAEKKRHEDSVMRADMIAIWGPRYQERIDSCGRVYEKQTVAKQNQ